MISPTEIEQAVMLLKQGKLVAFPTETVYGLGADANNPTAVERIFIAKGRPVNHPVIVHVADSSQLYKWARDVSPVAKKLAEHFWPGPLTLILRRAAQVSDQITGGQDCVGLRAPAHPVAQALLKAFDGGIAAPSANRFGHVSPTQAQHVQEELGDKIDFILDGGACELGIESTIVDVSSGQPRILRPGLITTQQINAVLEQPIIDPNEDRTLRVSGNLLSHYSPQTFMRRVASDELENLVKQFLDEGERLVVLSFGAAAQKSNAVLHWITMPADAKSYAHELYAQLHIADAAGCDLILVEDVPDTEEWLAIRDRLTKAAATLDDT